ncbi:hypothetical protein P153DRAFT_406986 [Dothidotthia symphoricarpi CBS 119687]|uniref:RBR-type E3 ubiquitin transferase n=1 Tax=Dothidotthia symphoricarpi CBS 119687 TaxID=1392245 RepID=A0A6A6A7H4_9PLEO|nr:uncharacterized protein P153DRAFT_406986 [Dothidotthia symphoricarpi CBS 119687]KAF2126738.1 hypothetical protein P153DRAFT_406986 [Dothidotthia symphoricarpi CBS 119687]
MDFDPLSSPFTDLNRWLDSKSDTEEAAKYSQRRTGRFWKNCKICRDKVTATRRRTRILHADDPQGVNKKRKISKTNANTDQAEQEPDTSERECSVCAELHPTRDFPSLSACTHEPEVCQDCFLEWLELQIDSTTWESIQCPSSDCSNQITHEDVLKYTPENVFARFDELSMRSVLSNDPNFRYCIAEGCTSGQIHDTGAEGYIFRCGACGFRICTVHDMPFHSDETCTQYDARMAKEEEERRAKQQQLEKEEEARRLQEEASVAEVGRCAVVCPGCKAPIQKTAGCDHMTCRRLGCNFQFCYVCRAPYTGDSGINAVGNGAHASDCRHHPARLPVYQPTSLRDLMILRQGF